MLSIWVCMVLFSEHLLSQSSHSKSFFLSWKNDTCFFICRTTITTKFTFDVIWNPKLTFWEQLKSEILHLDGLFLGHEEWCYEQVYYAQCRNICHKFHVKRASLYKLKLHNLKPLCSQETHWKGFTFIPSCNKVVWAMGIHVLLWIERLFTIYTFKDLFLSWAIASS